MREDKITFRTSGFALYLFSSFLIFIVYVIYSLIIDFLQKGIHFGNFFALVLFLYFGLFIFVLITIPKIEIDKDVLTIQNSFSKKFQWFPKPHNFQIPIT